PQQPRGEDGDLLVGEAAFPGAAQTDVAVPPRVRSVEGGVVSEASVGGGARGGVIDVASGGGTTLGAVDVHREVVTTEPHDHDDHVVVDRWAARVGAGLRVGPVAKRYDPVPMLVASAADASGDGAGAVLPRERH